MRRSARLSRPGGTEAATSNGLKPRPRILPQTRQAVADAQEPAPEPRASSPDDVPLCTICIEELPTKRTMSFLPCAHTLHRTCAIKVLETKEHRHEQVCPNCMGRVIKLKEDGITIENHYLAFGAEQPAPWLLSHVKYDNGVAGSTREYAERLRRECRAEIETVLDHNVAAAMNKESADFIQDIDDELKKLSDRLEIYDRYINSHSNDDSDSEVEYLGTLVREPLASAAVHHLPPGPSMPRMTMPRTRWFPHAYLAQFHRAADDDDDFFTSSDDDPLVDRGRPEMRFDPSDADHPDFVRPLRSNTIFRDAASGRARVAAAAPVASVGADMMLNTSDNVSPPRTSRVVRATRSARDASRRAVGAPGALSIAASSSTTGQLIPATAANREAREAREAAFDAWFAARVRPELVVPACTTTRNNDERMPASAANVSSTVDATLAPPAAQPHLVSARLTQRVILTREERAAREEAQRCPITRERQELYGFVRASSSTAGQLGPAMGANVAAYIAASIAPAAAAASPHQFQPTPYNRRHPITAEEREARFARSRQRNVNRSHAANPPPPSSSSSDDEAMPAATGANVAAASMDAIIAPAAAASPHAATASVGTRTAEPPTRQAKREAAPVADEDDADSVAVAAPAPRQSRKRTAAGQSSSRS